MKAINCAVIQDLLPSYCDKISSKETNLLVEEHLKTCTNCREKLKKLNKDLNIEKINSQQEEIDFLKGYKKKKRLSIVFTITIVLIIMFIIFLLINFVIPKYFTGKEYSIDINDVNLEYMYKVDQSSDSIMFYLYSDKHKELKGDILPIFNPSTGKNEISITIMGKKEIRSLAVRNLYLSGYENSVSIRNVDKIWIKDTKGNRKEIWNKDIKVPSKEEWAKWYIDSYVPEEVKNKEHLDYNSILYNGFSNTGTWRHLYKIKNI